MVTALQIALLLILIALIGIILGYIFGRLACKKRESSLYFEKSDYCEEQYTQNLMKDEVSGSANSTFNNDLATVARESESSRLDAAVATDSGANNEVQSLVSGDATGSGDASIEKGSEDIVSQASVEEKEAKESSALLDEAHDNAAKSESEVADESGATQEQAVDKTHESNNSTQENKSEAEEKSIANDDSVEATDDGVKPPVLSEPKNGTKDNLCRIKGIGNIIEGKLNDLGIFHFEQIAAWSEDEVKWIDSHLAFSGRILREDWIGQAKLLATGEETEFSKRVDKGEVATSKID